MRQQEHGQRCEVLLLNTPVDLMVQAREHHDEVLRELRLLEVTSQSPHLSMRLAGILGEVDSGDGAQASRLDEVLAEALAVGHRHVDLTYVVATDVAEGAADLEELLAEVDHFCDSGELITLPRSAQVKAFGRWYVEQFVTQLEGAAPKPWPDG